MQEHSNDKPSLSNGPAPIGAYEGIVAQRQNPRRPKQQHKKFAHPAGPRPTRTVSTSVPGTSAEPKRSAPREGGKGRPQGGGGKRGGKRSFGTQPIVRNVNARKDGAPDVPAIEAGKLRIIPIGGQEEVGRNMTIFEYGEDIIIIDMGLQFPEEDMPGIDYIVPNVSYLKGKEKNIRGVLFTHGHLDHIGAAPILLKQLNYPTIIGRDFTLALIQRKCEDEEKGAAKKLKAIRVKTLADRIKLGIFEIRFFEVEHSIMDAMGIAI
ncbi:MAG: ribonuclease J, partial [Candidatus Moraniibacteriota bacterium]